LKKIILFVTLISPILGLLFYYTSCNNTYKRLPIMGERSLAANGDTLYHTLPDFAFVTHTGDTLKSADIEGKYIVADYFFTTCNTICPIMSRHMEKVQSEFKNDDRVVILSHTVDPEYDSVQVLAAYAESHAAITGKWFFLTGDKKALYDQARYGYLISALEGDGGEDDFIHSDKFVLIDKDRRIRGFYDGTDTKDVKRLIDEIEVLKFEYQDRLK
jgi:protein SCO1/2